MDGVYEWYYEDDLDFDKFFEYYEQCRKSDGNDPDPKEKIKKIWDMKLNEKECFNEARSDLERYVFTYFIEWLYVIGAKVIHPRHETDWPWLFFKKPTKVKYTKKRLIEAIVNLRPDLAKFVGDVGIPELCKMTAIHCFIEETSEFFHSYYVRSALDDLNKKFDKIL